MKERIFIDSVGIVCGAGSVKLSSGFAAVGPATRRYRSIAARPALSSKCGQCPVVR